ncbi:hypothetical protein [Pseudidiomarina salilacus]|uniref:hypothetical protein n=1 Tax=Pseudidiomarina salilacus TaxID=3384452 RepID=UPI0039855D31
MSAHSFSSYFVWLRRYWWLAGGYVGLGAILALLLFSSLPRWYQAQTIFVINPELFNQGLLRRSDDIVLNSAAPTNDKPITTEPELRLARWIYSEHFTRMVAELLWDQASATEYYQVRRHLHYYRYQNDRFHALHWAASSPELAEQQLRAVFAMLEENLRNERRAELQEQLTLNQSLLEQTENIDYSEMLRQQGELLATRYTMLTTSDFRMLQPITAAIASPNPLFPQRIQVLLAVLFGWMALGVTVLHYYLLRRAPC